jgi:RHS repeat-associated protein
MQMPGRKFTLGEYRYGFNGKEKDDEIYTGVVSFEARIYDSRIGRFFSTDPREAEYAWQSTFVYYSNNPINVVDQLGMGGDGGGPAGYYHDKIRNVMQWFEENSTTGNSFKDADGNSWDFVGTEYYSSHKPDDILSASVTYHYKDNKFMGQVDINAGNSEMMALKNNFKLVGESRVFNLGLSSSGMSGSGNTTNSTVQILQDTRSSFHQFYVSGYGGGAFDAARGLWHTFTTEAGFGGMLESFVHAGYSQGAATGISLPQNLTQWGNITFQGTMVVAPMMKLRAAGTVIEGGDNLAFGLGSNLDEFSAATGFKNYRQFTSGGFKPAEIESAITNPSNKLHFNLTDFTRGRYLKYSNNPTPPALNNITNWELHTIYNTPGVLQRTTFYKFTNGSYQVVSNPF